jgi:predicted TPR repeat methyltransferase
MSFICGRGFASSFDQVLDALGYQTTQLIREQAAKVLDTRGGALAVTHIGCGTGLCGPLLRP